MNDIIEQVEACTDLIELNEIWEKYEHINEIRKAILIKTTQILSNLD
jgi:hypothetical protein